MPKVNKKLIKEYLQFRQDVGEEGFWVDVIKKSPSNAEKRPLKIKKTQGGKDIAFSNGVKEELRKISGEVENCRQCPLGSCRLNACFGKGSENADLFFIGEGPGYSEDHQGEVFIGPAGKLLDKIIEAALDLKPGDVYITNIVKCHPMKDPQNPHKKGNDRPPKDVESAACIDYLMRQISLIKPKVIVPLGAPATKTILNTTEAIGTLRGRKIEKEIAGVQLTVVPTYHPAYLLRDPSKKRDVYEDTKVIKSLL